MADEKRSRVEGGLVTDEFLESAGNVLTGYRGRAPTVGAEQYFTPKPVADFIARCLVEDPAAYEGPVLDPTGAGNGALLAPFQNRYGVEIDRDQATAPYTKILGDCQEVAGLATAIGMKCPLIVANPPFGLRWEYGGESGRSARIAWKIINSLIDAYGLGAMIVPRSDYEAIKAQEGEGIIACVEVPALFGPSVEVDCVIFFFAGHSLRNEPKNYAVANVERLPNIISTVKEEIESSTYFRPYAAPETADFIKKFSLIRAEMNERRKWKDAVRHSDITIRGEKISVYISPYERVRFAVDGRKAELDRILALNGQSVYQFARDHKEWTAIMALAQEIGLYITPSTYVAYEKAKAFGDALYAPMLAREGALLGLAELRNSEEVVCRKTDKGRFEAGEIYKVYSETTRITKPGTRMRKRHRTDARTGVPMEEWAEEEFTEESTGIRFTIGNEQFVVSGEEERETMRYLDEHFALPEVKTVEQYWPEEYERALAKVKKVVDKYDF
jgi:hypothetical protein